MKFDGYIDLGRELSLLHMLLIDALEDSDKVSYLVDKASYSWWS